MTEPNNDPTEPNVREVPIDWEALENAFENNAPEVHSYLQVVTGDVIRIVDGVADPQMHARIASDPRYLRIEAVSSREQYRWMERYIPTVEDPKLRARLEVSIDGKGAFRRFKDVLMAYGPERERWFAYRSERLRTFMEAWLAAHNIKAVPRTEWSAPPPEAEAATSVVADQPPSPAPGPEPHDVRRGRIIEAMRNRLRDHADALGPRDLESVVAFADFLKARRTARSFAHHGFHHGRRDDLQGEAGGEDQRDDDDADLRDEASDRPPSDSPLGQDT
jgi:hypothetical protein